MNYKNNSIRELSKMAEDFPEYTLGEILYSVIRVTKAKNIADVKILTDEDIFSAIEKALEEEKD